MVTICGVTDNSPAQSAGLMNGDCLISINGHEINDVLDYDFHLASSRVKLKIHRSSELFEVTIKKSIYQDIGLEFESFLMDEKRHCSNKCIFCFIDQLPKGMRAPLYFKDDDSRMSFIAGNYITTTNLSEKDIQRIVEMKTSPINISVHTTNPDLRVKMMKNPVAANIMDIMRRFYDANIKMNCQIVLCKGLNDGEELDRTMNDLASLYPAVESVSIVPAGLTKHRNNLYPLQPFTSAECAEIIDRVSVFADKCLSLNGTRIFYPGDELYVKSSTEIPSEESYEGFPQLENGVGMIASTAAEFERELRYINEYDTKTPRSISIATGEAAYDFICSMVEKLTKLCYSFECRVYKITNEFFGENITVAGLITGGDLANQLDGKPLGNKLYLPSVMLRHGGDMFLDDMTPAQLSKKLAVDIEFVGNDGAEFLSALLSADISGREKTAEDR